MTGPGEGDPGRALADPRDARPETECHATPPSRTGP